MPLRVLIDATAVPADRGGVGRYVDELLPALLDEGVDVVVVAQRRDLDDLRSRVPAATLLAAPGVVARRAARLAWEQVGLPLLARRARVDVLHSPHYTMPLLSPVPVVVTLHDATFFSHPHLHGRVKARFFRTWTRISVARAAALVVPSQATGDEVGRTTRRTPRHLQVAYHGVDHDRFHPVPDDERARVARSLGLEDRTYVGFLGTLEPRKNVPALVAGWVRAVAGRDDAPALVLAGSTGWDEGVDPAVAAVPDDLRVVRPGYLPFEDLAGFLAGSQVVAYPSLGEGFGLPVLEAMACGAAVLTTRELSLPEVGGDAVAYCGTSVDAIATALRELLDDPERRAGLSERARTRAAGFTWAAAARAHVAAYTDALR